MKNNKAETESVVNFTEIMKQFGIKKYIAVLDDGSGAQVVTDGFKCVEIIGYCEYIKADQLKIIQDQ